MHELTLATGGAILIDAKRCSCAAYIHSTYILSSVHLL